MINQSGDSLESGRRTQTTPEQAWGNFSVYQVYLTSAWFFRNNPVEYAAGLRYAEDYRQIVMYFGHPDPAIPVECPYPPLIGNSDF